MPNTQRNLGEHPPDAKTFSNLSAQSDTDMKKDTAKNEAPVIPICPSVKISPVQIIPAKLLGVRLSAAPHP